MTVVSVVSIIISIFLNTFEEIFIFIFGTGSFIGD